MPSGRCHYYYKPNVKPGERGFELSAEFGKYGRKKIWGGVIVENLVQGYCRDLLCAALVEAEKSKLLTPVGTIHDEILCESAQLEKALKELQRIMSTAHNFAPGFPLAAECKIMERYGK